MESQRILARLDELARALQDAGVAADESARLLESASVATAHALTLGELAASPRSRAKITVRELEPAPSRDVRDLAA